MGKSTKMAILFVMNHYPDSRNGGIENVTRLLSAKLKEIGYSIHIRFLYKSDFDHSDDSIFDSCEYLEWNNIEKEFKSIVLTYNIDVIVNRCVIIAAPILRKSIDGTGCKLITTYNNKPTLTSRRIGEIWGDSSISFSKKIAIMMFYPIYRHRSIKRLRELHQTCYQSTDALVLLSSQYVKEYTDLYGVDKDKIFVINNPIKSGIGITESELERKEKIVLMVTRLDEEQKCVIKALKLWNAISATMSDWRLVIIGSGPDEEKIKTYCKNEKLRSVKFISATNPTEYYKRSTIFLMTSRNEGWPNTLNEAMRYGCIPVVLATFSAVYDMIDNEKNGYIVESDTEEKDIEEMHKVIANLSSETENLNSMALFSIEKTQRLSIENIIPQWIQLFNN